MKPVSFRFVTAVGILLIAIVGGATAQDKPPLRIESPRNGTVVHPGDTITVVVSSPSGTAAGAFVLGEGGIEGGDMAFHFPARFSVSIPAKLRPGRYMLSAVGKVPGGREPVDAMIELDVEPPENNAQGASVTADASVEKIKGDERLILGSQGEEFPLAITATYSNGKQQDISESSRLIFRSSNPSIATVTANRMVKAVGRGEASITAIYVEHERSIQCVIPVTVEAAVVSAAPAMLNFGTDRPTPVGSSVTRQVVLTYNTDNPTLRIQRVTTTGDFSQTNDCVSSSQTRAEKTCSVTITFTPTESGRREGTLTLDDNWTIAPTTVPLIGLATAH